MPSSYGGTLVRASVVAVVVLAAIPQDVRTQDGVSAEAREFERHAAQMALVREEQRSRLERTRAHARMPSTMYASTPDRVLSHPFPLVASSSSTQERADATTPSAPLSPAPVERTHRIAFFPAASHRAEGGYQGLARIVNRAETAGEVRIDAFDDEGVAHGPLILDIDAGASTHITSQDLEQGNALIGLDGASGEGKGDWRLDLTSELEFEVLAYIRTGDGFLTSMHDRVPSGAAGHRVAMFNPGSNVNQVSRLRLVNPGSEAAAVLIEAIDDTGAPAADMVRIELGPGAARTVSARELESGGTGLAGALGTGRGRWRLVVSSPQALEVMNLLLSPTGHVINLSTSTANVDLDGAAFVHEVPLFPSAARRWRDGLQGFVRIVNHSDQAGTVRIDAFDDEGIPSTPLTLAIGANAAVHFNSGDLEDGNPGEGLGAGVGIGTGDWRLRLRSSLDLKVVAYVYSDDGFLASVHDLVPRTDAGHRLAVPDAGSGFGRMSLVRLLNLGAQPALVSIEAIDGHGSSASGAVRLEVPARGARTVSTHQLKTGAGVDGLGVRGLTVTADHPIEVMSLLESPAGHLANLSTSLDAMSADEVFRESISGPVVQSRCVNCHVADGIAGAFRLHFVPSTTPNHPSHNFDVFRNFLDVVEDGAALVLAKIQGIGHGGRLQFAAGTDEFADMERFLALLGEEIASTPSIAPEALFDTVRMAPARKTLRRAALVFAGRIPTDEEYAAAEQGPDDLRATIRGLMTGPEFHEFLVRGANDRLLTDRNIGQVIDHNVGRYFVEFVNETYRRREAAFGIDKRGRYYDWNDRSQHGFRRAPVELIAHVVENDLPYTEILTADYIMANPWAAAAYGASTTFDDPEDIYEFKPSKIESYYREGEGFESEFNRAIGSTRIVDPGPLRTNYPHAGLLNTTSFLLRYPTTATNRNRARSRWTYYHFLGLDIEKSAPRTTDPVALADTNNPTMRNPACTVCHVVLDPVAGAFQNYGDEGFYRDKRGGMDSLDRFYKDGSGTSLPIRADSWHARETLSWTVPLGAGVETLRVYFPNDFWHDATRTTGTVYLDRMRVVDAKGHALTHLEFESVTPPPPPRPDGECGRARRNPSTRRIDHYRYGWGGRVGCALYVDVTVPADGTYTVEIVAWADRYDPGRHPDRDTYSELSVAVNPYRSGDTWYRDMREPGFGDELAPDPDNSVQWLAEKIVADDRFAEATVKFWWPAIMGSEVAEPPEDERDADFEGLLVAASAQGAEVARLAEGFRLGFHELHEGRAYNLKDLLVEIVLSEWFRADAVEDADPVRRVALREAGARRLLTPEELARKTLALTGVQWERRINEGWPYEARPSALTIDYRLLYGGIDSDGVTKRARDLTPVMAGVAKRHAMQIACAAVTREFYLRPKSEWRLFDGIDRNTTDRGAIRGKLVELHDKLLGVEVTPDSVDVETAYGVFADARERRRRSGDTWFDHWNCYAGAHDRFFFEGLLDDIIVEKENEKGHRWHDFDWGRVEAYLDRIDWSDHRHTAHAWVVVLAYLLMDYRYLYL